MSKLVKQTELELKEKIMDALGRAVADGVLDEAPLPAFIIEVPKERQNGDYSTNVAMAGAKAFHKAPRVIAQAIVDRLDLADTVFDRAEIAGPGFINFFLGNRFYAAVLEDLMAQGENYGRSDYGKGKRVLVEFVSANPTGPMHIGNARGGAIGDCLASVLDWAGYDVQREFYVNDAGGGAAGGCLQGHGYCGARREFHQGIRRPVCERLRRGAAQGAGGLRSA